MYRPADTGHYIDSCSVPRAAPQSWSTSNSLDRTDITNAGLKTVGRLPGLQGLSLTETHVTNAGLAELKDLTGLRELRLDRLGIGDAGLAHLPGPRA